MCDMIGTIPLTIQTREWVNLDLRTNQLFGTLSNRFGTVGASAALRLDRNRLAGAVPTSIKLARNLSVLDGNLFECYAYEQSSDSGLPKNDKNVDSYLCANELQQLSILWAIPYELLLLTVLSLGVVFYCRKTIRSYFEMTYVEVIEVARIINAQLNVNDPANNISLFYKFMRDWSYVNVIIVLFIMIILLPSWTVLTHYYKVYAKEYAWTVSFAYLTGTVPSVLALVLLVILLWGVGCCNVANAMKHETKSTAMSLNESRFRDAWYDNVLHSLIMLLVLIVNGAVVISVNGFYVWATMQLSRSMVNLITFLVAAFRIFWGGIVLRAFFTQFNVMITSKKSAALKLIQTKRELAVHVWMSLSNSVIFPALATGFVSTTCFHNAFYPDEAVRAAYQYSRCVVQPYITHSCRFVETVMVCNDVAGTSYRCVGESTVNRETTFDPPFIYNYGCSSNLLTAYVGVFVYAYLIQTFVLPPVMLVLAKLRKSYPDADLRAQALDLVLPFHMYPLKTEDKMLNVVFDKASFIVTVITDTAVLLTFGVMYPPLSLIVGVSMLVNTCYVVFNLEKLLLAADKDSKYMKYRPMVNYECFAMPDYVLHLAQLILPFSAFFYALFIFDTYGDAVGMRGAAWACVVMALAPFVFQLLLSPALRTFLSNKGVSDNGIFPPVKSPKVHPARELPYYPSTDDTKSPSNHTSVPATAPGTSAASSAGRGGVGMTIQESGVSEGIVDGMTREEMNV
jgi:hypothetical protein